jgi:hypothetical protein
VVESVEKLHLLAQVVQLAPFSWLDEVELEESKERLTTYVDLQLGPGIEKGMLSQDARNLGLGLLIYIRGRWLRFDFLHDYTSCTSPPPPFLKNIADFYLQRIYSIVYVRLCILTIATRFKRDDERKSGHS